MPDNSQVASPVAVFQFEVFDRNTRAWSVMPYRATQRYIDTFGGVALPGTMRWVAEAEVDAAGIHRPAAVAVEASPG